MRVLIRRANKYDYQDDNSRLPEQRYDRPRWRWLELAVRNGAGRYDDCNDDDCDNLEELCSAVDKDLQKASGNEDQAAKKNLVFCFKTTYWIGTYSDFAKKSFLLFFSSDF